MMAQGTSFNLYATHIHSCIRYEFHVNHTNGKVLVLKFWNDKPLSMNTKVQDKNGNTVFQISHKKEIEIFLARDFWNILVKDYKFTRNPLPKTA